MNTVSYACSLEPIFSVVVVVAMDWQEEDKDNPDVTCGHHQVNEINVRGGHIYTVSYLQVGGG